MAGDGADLHGLEGLRHGQLKASVGTGLVVVAEVLGEHGLEVTAGEDEHVVHALLACSPHPALGER